MFAITDRDSYGFTMIEKDFLGIYARNDGKVGRDIRKICARCRGSTTIMSTDLADTDS